MSALVDRLRRWPRRLAALAREFRVSSASANSHDLFHVVAGYDRDVTGEVGVIAYTARQIPLLPLSCCSRV